ncbi:MAG: Clostripain family protein [Alistipes sp.]|nr:Clostripain family protein [Alistipes sp.]
MALRRLAACLLLLAATACGKDPVPDPNPEGQQTVLMYLPWSGNLTGYFRQNIADMERIVAADKLHDARLLVYFMESATTATLFELVPRQGGCQRVEIASYDRAPAFTTAEGLAAILGAAKAAAPAARYGLVIGCHGMGWLPAEQASGRAAAPMQAREREYWEHEADGRPLTRWFGGTTPAYQTDIATLAEGIARAGMPMEYILFDDCYMSSIEVAYELRGVTRHLIGSTSEIMAYGFPYAELGEYLFGEVDYEAICEAFHRFYSAYQYPYGTIGVTDCAQLEALAEVMRRINGRYVFSGDESDLQRLDGYSPVRFFDMGDYVRRLCPDEALRAEAEELLRRAVPHHRHTERFYSMVSGSHPIRTFSGITTSDPSTAPLTVDAKRLTAWWQATH